MRVGHEPDQEERFLREGLGRIHPWTTSELDPKGRYVNFREHPELIEAALEDFQPFATHGAIQRFYRMLKWVNGPTSELETNDCILKPPAGTSSWNQIPVRYQIRGRVTVLFRDYQLNVSDPDFKWLTDSLHKRLADKDRKFKYGAIDYSRWTHRFAALHAANQPCDGWVAAIRFWAWGDAEREIFANLDRVFANLEDALHYISAGVRTHAPSLRRPSPE